MAGVRGINVMPDVLQEAADIQMLEVVTQCFCGILKADKDTDRSPLWTASAQQRVSRFVHNFLNLSEADIMDLEIAPTRAEPHPPAAPLMEKHRLAIALAAFHHFSHLKGTCVDISF